jgi:hypothetical protein
MKIIYPAILLIPYLFFIRAPSICWAGRRFSGGDVRRELRGGGRKEEREEKREKRDKGKKGKREKGKKEEKGKKFLL